MKETDLHQEIKQLRDKLVSLSAENSQLKNKIVNLNSILDAYKKKSFLAKAEPFHHPGQGTLFDEAEAILHDQKKHDVIEVKAHKKRKKRRKSLPDSLPREEKILDVKPEEKICACGCEKKKIGEDVSEKLEVIPQKVTVIRNIRPKYSCPKCKEKISQSPAPKAMIAKSFATPSLLSHIVAAKYVDGLPLYRQEAIWKRAGVDLSRATMAHWIIKTAKEMTPLYNLIKEHTFSGLVVHLDETKLQVLKESGKKPESLSYAWVAVRNDDEPCVFFEYYRNRSGKVAAELLDSYQGYVVTDGYKGYDSALNKRKNLHCGCWDHARREFYKAFEATKKDPHSLAYYALYYIKALYAVERRENNSTPERRWRARQLYSEPIIRHLYKWINRNACLVPKTSPIGNAYTYALNQEQKLKRFLFDGNIPISNQIAENAIRPFVIGRKGWLFADTPKGADASMILYTLVESAKINGHEPFSYLNQVFEKIPYCTSLTDYEALLPWIIQKN